MASILLLTFLLQHPVLPAKAGYLTYYHGFTNVKLDDFIVPGQRLQTYRHTFVEAMLNPGSYLRVDESSEIVLESASLQRIVVRLLKGSMAIEAVDVDRKRPIAIFSEHMELRIVKPGHYRFSIGSAHVLEGKLETPALDKAVDKGWKLTWADSGVEKTPIDKWESHPLEGKSRYRSAVIYSRQGKPNRILRPGIQ